eukprot:4331083-Amphidinium_carterae.2
MDELLKSRYDFKSGGVLGLDPDDGSEVTYLNRVIRYVKRSNPRVEIEHDMRHLDYLMRDLGLDGIRVKTLDCPSVKFGMQEVQRRTDEKTLAPADCTWYRSGVMRVAYLSLDRPDLVHAVKCLSRHMQQPKESHFADLQRVGRYLQIPTQPQVLGERLQQTDVARQGRSHSRHGL